MDRSIGMLLVVLGLLLAGVGLLVATGAFSWFGRLPGDIRIETENTRVYIPLVSMLIVSIVLSAALYAIGRFLR